MDHANIERKLMEGEPSTLLVSCLCYGTIYCSNIHIYRVSNNCYILFKINQSLQVLQFYHVEPED